MKLLFCCENYWPSRGGVQEVIRQIAERLAIAGHKVEIATASNRDRKSNVLNGVRIHEFNVHGNQVLGLRGEVNRYRDFMTAFDGDAILIKAAQQWTFDALWPVLDEIKTRKVFVPCGFSSLYEPNFARYFAQMPEILRKFDHLIFYAEKYRDIDFTRSFGIDNLSVIPNGASEIDFGRARRGRLRKKLGIPDDDLLFLTVGSPIAMKGHNDLGAAFARMRLERRNATLILNGNWPSQNLFSRLPQLMRAQTIARGFGVLRREGWQGVRDRLMPVPDYVMDTSLTRRPNPADRKAINQSEAAGQKRVLRLDLPRSDVIDAFFDADLFVFASKVEYSPLVLFESAAAGTPFLTVPVGNAREIIEWTGAGLLCPAGVDEHGYTVVSSEVLAKHMEEAVRSPDNLRSIGAAGRQAWQKSFTWEQIARSYANVLAGGPSFKPINPQLNNPIGA